MITDLLVWFTYVSTKNINFCHHFMTYFGKRAQHFWSGDSEHFEWDLISRDLVPALLSPPSPDLSDTWCEHPSWRLCFQVTAPRPSPLSPSSPDLSDTWMQTPLSDALFLSYSTKSITTVTTYIRSIRDMLWTPLPGVLFSSYSTKTIITVTTFTSSIRYMVRTPPAGGSVLKLRHQDHHHCDRLSIRFM